MPVPTYLSLVINRISFSPRLGIASKMLCGLEKMLLGTAVDHSFNSLVLFFLYEPTCRFLFSLEIALYGVMFCEDRCKISRFFHRNLPHGDMLAKTKTRTTCIHVRLKICRNRYMNFTIRFQHNNE